MQLDFERYEYKYVIPMSLWQPIQHFIAGYAKPDFYTTQGQGQGYVITSLYLDTPQLTFHRAKDQGDLNRMKLRIRTYGEKPGTPIFYEIKRKIKGVVVKRRVQVYDAAWLDHSATSQDLLVHPSTRNLLVLQEFMGLCERYQVSPSVVVRYVREAYGSDIDAYGRVTLDRCLSCHLPQGYSLYPGLGEWLPLDDSVSMDSEWFQGGAAILELKFENRAPLWMFDLVQHFGLQLRGFSKYSTAVSCGQISYRPGSDQRIPKFSW